MKRSLSLDGWRDVGLVVAGAGLIAGTYGLVRLAYGLFLPDISGSIEMGTSTAGFIASGSSVAYCVGALAGVVLDGHPRVLVVSSVATASGGALAMALAPSLAFLAPAVVVASTGAGLASPGLVAVVARSIAPQRADAAQATVNAGTGPGLVAAGVLALVMPDWRAAFVLSAVVTALAGGGVLLLDRGRGGPAAGLPPQPEGAGASLLALRVPAVAAIMLGVASAATWTYGRTQLAATGASDTATVLAWVALGVGGTATVLTAGRLASLSPQRAWMLTSAVVAASTAGLGLTAAPLLLHVAACVGFGWGFVAASSALIAWAGRVLPARGAAGTSVLFVALVLGQAAGASLAGLVADGHGMSTAFLLAALVALVAAACGWREDRRATAGGSRGADQPGPSDRTKVRVRPAHARVVPARPGSSCSTGRPVVVRRRATWARRAAAGAGRARTAPPARSCRTRAAEPRPGRWERPRPGTAAPARC